MTNGQKEYELSALGVVIYLVISVWAGRWAWDALGWKGFVLVWVAGALTNFGHLDAVYCLGKQNKWWPEHPSRSYTGTWAAVSIVMGPTTIIVATILWCERWWFVHQSHSDTART